MVDPKEKLEEGKFTYSLSSFEAYKFDCGYGMESRRYSRWTFGSFWAEKMVTVTGTFATQRIRILQGQCPMPDWGSGNNHQSLLWEAGVHGGVVLRTSLLRKPHVIMSYHDYQTGAQEVWIWTLLLDIFPPKNKWNVMNSADWTQNAKNPRLALVPSTTLTSALSVLPALMKESLRTRSTPMRTALKSVCSIPFSQPKWILTLLSFSPRPLCQLLCRPQALVCSQVDPLGLIVNFASNA